MSPMISPATGKPYGVQRACEVSGVGINTTD
jgi:hypothetical protein